MPVYTIDPGSDPRWAAFVESDPGSSIFHTAAWLEALRRTYNYIPTVFTTSPGGTPLTNGIVFCRVNSWLTGSRLVSIPFSDHCEPLVRDGEELHTILSETTKSTSDKLKYVEVRSRTIEPDTQCGFQGGKQYALHTLNLDCSLEEIYSRLHKNSVQRKIRRATNERVILDQGRSELLLKEFYELLLRTRRRHRVPPQPYVWFHNLVKCLGSRLTIRVARAGNRPIASILTLVHKNTIVYKYGCSDERFHMLGGMYHLFWQAIQEASSKQMKEFDLGRSEESNAGLLRFKDNLGGTRTTLKYWRWPGGMSDHSTRVLSSSLTQGLLAHLPDRLFRLAGEISYRHAG